MGFASGNHNRAALRGLLRWLLQVLGQAAGIAALLGLGGWAQPFA